MGEEGTGSDLFHSSKALHVRGAAQLKLSEQGPIGSEGGECRHGLDETTEGGRSDNLIVALIPGPGQRQWDARLLSHAMTSESMLDQLTVLLTQRSLGKIYLAPVFHIMSRAHDTLAHSSRPLCCDPSIMDEPS